MSVSMLKVGLRDSDIKEPKIGWEVLGFYYDLKTGIPFQARKCSEKLEVGGRYQITYTDDETDETSIYSYIVISEINKGVYLVCECYNGRLMRWEKNLMGRGTVMCSIKDFFGIDLKEFEEHVKYLYNLSEVGGYCICPKCGKPYRLGNLTESDDWKCEECGYTRK